jgi:hypothetical protein
MVGPLLAAWPDETTAYRGNARGLRDRQAKAERRLSPGEVEAVGGLDPSANVPGSVAGLERVGGLELPSLAQQPATFADEVRGE